MQLANRRRHITKQKNMQHDRTNRHLLVENQKNRQQNNHHDTELLDKSFQTIINKIGFPGKHLAFHQFHLKIILLFAFKFFSHETFNHHN